jgi:hypothetical protein
LIDGARESRLRELVSEHKERHRRFRADHREKSNRLLRVLLPNIATSTLQRLPEMGFTFAQGLIKKIKIDRDRCSQELKTLEEHPILQQGCLGEELEKLSGHYDALQPFLKKCFKHPRFDQLLLDGYGTDEYPKRVWHLSYYIDRRAAAEIEEMCEGRTFASIRREAIQALEASTVLKERIKELKQKRKLQASTEKRRKTLVSRLESHTQVWLDSARRQLLEELERKSATIMDNLLEVCPEPAFEWRLSKEILDEHDKLWTNYLNSAQEALEQGQRGRSDFLVKEYEHLSTALKKFDRHETPRESIDWKQIIYRDIGGTEPRVDSGQKE